MCGDIFIGENLSLTHGLNLYGYACNMREVESVWTCTSMRGWHGRGYFCDSFVDKSSVLKIKKLHPAHVEVVGSVVGAVETFINSKVDAAQPGVVKGLEEALMQHQEKLQVIAEEADILPILADPESYEADLAELKTNPGFATMVRLQEMRRARSEVASVVPSRQSSPGMEE